jgi:hypothetical protein
VESIAGQTTIKEREIQMGPASEEETSDLVFSPFFVRLIHPQTHFFVRLIHPQTHFLLRQCTDFVDPILNPRQPFFDPARPIPRIHIHVGHPLLIATRGEKSKESDPKVGKKKKKTEKEQGMSEIDARGSNLKKECTEGSRLDMGLPPSTRNLKPTLVSHLELKQLPCWCFCFYHKDLKCTNILLKKNPLNTP